MLTAYSQGKDRPIEALLILLHGLGADGHDFVDIIPELSPSHNIKALLPHAPVQPLTLAGGEPISSWYDIITTGTPRIINQDQLAQSRERIHQLILQDESYGKVPLIMAGFSQGGALALECFLHLPLDFAGCLAMSTYLINPPQQAANHRNGKRPLLIQHGIQDPVVPYTLGENAAETLADLGFEVDWQSYPMQHQVCMPQLQATRQWLKQQLSTSQTTTS